jgi:hypothetical protein
MSAGDGFFVDSNVLLYSVDPVDSAKRIRATEWLEALWMAGAGRLRRITKLNTSSPKPEFCAKVLLSQCPRNLAGE